MEKVRVRFQIGETKLEKAVKVHIQRKIELALMRGAPYISSISVILNNQYSSNDELQIRCCLKIAIANQPALEVEDIQTDLYYAIDRVIHKATRILARKLFTAGIHTKSK